MSRWVLRMLGSAVGVGVILAGGPAALAAPRHPVRTVDASVATDGTLADGDSAFAMLSADGRFVAFASEADNLVPGGAGGVFVRDLASHMTELVSVASDGTIGDGPSWWPSISADGRYVAFQSQASNLVPGDTDGADDVFVHDRLTGSTELVSVEDDGYPMFSDAQRPSISGDGRYVAFVAGSSSGQGTVFVRDRVAGHTITVSAAQGGAPANALSESPVISTNGQDVAFSSWASNLVPGDTNNASDIFVYDLPSARVSQVSLGPSGEGDNAAFTPAISGDGRYVTFVSQAGNLTPETDETVLHLFVRDRAAEQTKLVSRAADGTSSNGDTVSSALDFTGRFIAYGTTATDIVPGQVAGRQDVLRYDQVSGQTTMVPAGMGGAAPNGGSTTPTLDRTGRRVAYWSEASNLVPNDTNKLGDVFVTTR